MILDNILRKAYYQDMNIIVEFRYDRWEVIRQYGYRESLIGLYNTEKEANEVAEVFRGFDQEVAK